MMPDRVHDIGYRPLGGQATGAAPWPIARTMLVLAWRRRATKIALLICLGVFGITAAGIVGQILFQRFGGMGNALPVEKIIGSTEWALAKFLMAQFYVSALALAAVAGGAIADDRLAGAFELYFSRPLTRLQYVLGKLLGAVAVPTVTIIIPAVLLWLIAIGIAPPAMRSQLWPLLLPMLAGAALSAVLLASTIVGISAIGHRARTVGVAYVAGLFLIAIICEALVSEGMTWAGYLSPERDLRTVVDTLLNAVRPALEAFIPQRTAMSNQSVFFSVVGLAGYIAAGLSLIAMRLRGEVAG